MRGLPGRKIGQARHLALNRDRGARARAHLERARERERRRRRAAERTRERARQRGGQDATARRRWSRGLLFVASLAAGVLLASPAQHVLQSRLTLFSPSGESRVETIAVQGNAHLSFEDVAEATGVAPDGPMAEVDIHDVVARLESEGWIRAAQVLVLPPSTLLVRVEERVPSAILMDGTNRVLGKDDAQSGAGRLVDATGMPFAPLRGRRAVLGEAGLPRIVGGRSLASGEVHPTLVTALALLERFRATSGALGGTPDGVARVHLPGDGDEGWVLEVPDRTLRVVLGRDHLLERFDRLSALLRAQLPALDQPVRIDLRFADQAVLRVLAASS